VIREHVQDLPSTLPELYRKYFELILGRWDLGKGLQGQKEYEALEAVLMRLAEYIIENQLDSISLDEAHGFFRDYLGERKGLELTVDGIFARASDRCELVFFDRQHGTFQFRHRTFAEFLYAKHRLRSNGFEISSRIFELYWRNSFYFYVGLLGDCPTVLRAAIRLSPEGDLGAWSKFKALPQFLLAAYRTPDTVVREAVEQCLLEFTRLYLGIRNGEIKSAFSVVPELYLLWLFQGYFRSQFGYRFFHDALEEAAVHTGTDVLSQEERAYALFFAAVAYLESGGKNSFDFLLDKSGLKLPFPLQLAIDYEGRNMKEKSALLKKHERNVRRSLKDNPKLRSVVERLKKKPVSALGE